jgi:hypothetical protein
VEEALLVEVETLVNLDPRVKDILFLVKGDEIPGKDVTVGEMIKTRPARSNLARKQMYMAQQDGLNERAGGCHYSTTSPVPPDVVRCMPNWSCLPSFQYRTLKGNICS